MSLSRASSATRRKALFQYVLDRRSISVYGTVLLVVVGLLGSTQLLPNLLLVPIVLGVVAYEFQKRLDQGVPLLQLTGLISVLQWLVGPVLAYNLDYQYGRYQMYVDEATYFEYALPATALYVAVMLAIGASIRQRELLADLDRSNFVKIGFFLNIAAFVVQVAITRAPSSLFFFLALITQARYVGAIYFLMSRHPLRLLFAAGSLAFLLMSSVSVGMFHDMLLWLALTFCYWFARRRWTLQAKLLTLSVSALLLFALQVVKQDYRQQLKSGQQPSLVGMMFSYLAPTGAAWSDGALAYAVVRLNQGWIVSKIMEHVPDEEPYADGETIKQAFVSSLLPRFLAPDKKEAGGRENFMRYTGLNLEMNTSMGISPLGEAYANFGTLGGALTMMGFGAFFGFLFKLTLRLLVRRPTFFFWLPLIFYQSIKAETEFVVVLNQLSKGSVVAVALFLFTDLNFPVRARKFVLKPMAAMRRVQSLRTQA